MRSGSRDSSPGLDDRSRRENSCELHDQRVSEGDVLHVTITSATCANGLPGRFPASPTDMTTTSDGRLDWFGVIFSKRGSG